MRYILCLSYNGRDFCGWQIQPSAPSVQGALETALSRLLGCPVAVTGAGRTDTSVHASGYIAHFDLSGPLPFPAGDFCYKVNAILPRSVVVHSVTPAPVGDAAGVMGAGMVDGVAEGARAAGMAADSAAGMAGGAAGAGVEGTGVEGTGSAAGMAGGAAGVVDGAPCGAAGVEGTGGKAAGGSAAGADTAGADTAGVDTAGADTAGVVDGAACGAGVMDGFHARFSARRRSYTYFLHRVKDPFLDAFSWQCGYPGLDFGAMNEACRFLVGTHDFNCFEKTGGNAKTSRCTVYEAFWKPYTPSHIAVMGSPRLVMGDAWGTTSGAVGGTGMPGGAFGGTVGGAGHGLAGNVGSAGTAGRAGATGGRGTDIGRASWIHTDYQTVTASPFPQNGEGTSAKSLIHSTELYESKYWYFRISADRFLRNMVRAIVGSLIEVGRGKQRPEWIRELVMDGTRSDAGESVPGHALFLNRVEY